MSFTIPTRTSVLGNKIKKSTPVPSPITSSLIQRIPGVNRSAASRPESVQKLQQNFERMGIGRQEELTPLDAYKKSLQERIDRGQQYTNRVVQSAFQKKYNLKNNKNTVKQQAQQQQSQNQYGGGVTRGGWGNYRNGNIPLNALTPIGGGHYMRPDAAQAFARMNAAYRQAFGANMSITDSYRSYANQVLLRRTKPTLSATPGTSNHGWGLALDLGGGINRWGTAQNNWMRQNASKFGFAPLSGRMGAREPWHWEYRG